MEQAETQVLEDIAIEEERPEETQQEPEKIAANDSQTPEDGIAELKAMLEQEKKLRFEAENRARFAQQEAKKRRKQQLRERQKRLEF